MVLRWAWDRLWGAPPTPEPVEERAEPTGFAATHFANIDAAVATGQPSATQTAAVVSAVDLLSRSFALAVATPAVPALNAPLWAIVAMELALYGNFAARIVVRQGQIVLLPASGFEVIAGTEDPATWVYSLKFNRPNQFDPVTRIVPAEGVVHIRIGASAAQPWYGRSALSRAGITAETVARIEQSLLGETRAPVAHAIPMPDGISENNATRIATALGTNVGGTQILEAQEATYSASSASSSGGPRLREQFIQKDFGPHVPQGSLLLRESSAEWIVEAMGVPGKLHGGEGAALRESFRHLFTTTIKSWAALCEAEFRDKLEIDNLTLRFPAIVQADLSARSRAAGTLIMAGGDFVSVMAGVGLDDIQKAEEDDFQQAREARHEALVNGLIDAADTE